MESNQAHLVDRNVVAGLPMRTRVKSLLLCAAFVVCCGCSTNATRRDAHRERDVAACDPSLGWMSGFKSIDVAELHKAFEAQSFANFDDACEFINKYIGVRGVVDHFSETVLATWPASSVYGVYLWGDAGDPGDFEFGVTTYTAPVVGYNEQHLD